MSASQSLPILADGARVPKAGGIPRRGARAAPPRRLAELNAPPQPPPTDASLAFRSPLLSIEAQLLSAMAGDEVSPTLPRAAACFDALKSLVASASQPFRPLLMVLHRELWAAVYDKNRGGLAHFDELQRLRALVAQRDAELMLARDDANRLAIENGLLHSELRLTDIPRTVSVAAAPSSDGAAKLMRLTSDASGRNVFDRVDDAKAGFRKGIGASTRRSLVAEMAEPIVEEPATAATDPSGRAGDEADSDDEEGSGRPASAASEEMRRLKETLRGSVSRSHYDSVVGQLKEAQQRLMEVGCIRRRACTPGARRLSLPACAPAGLRWEPPSLPDGLGALPRTHRRCLVLPAFFAPPYPRSFPPASPL
jgi:hypothetical protein